MSTLDEEDRREYYRIEDSVALKINRLPSHGAVHQAHIDETSTLFAVLSDLHLSACDSRRKNAETLSA